MIFYQTHFGIFTINKNKLKLSKMERNRNANYSSKSSYYSNVSKTPRQTATNSYNLNKSENYSSKKS